MTFPTTALLALVPNPQSPDATLVGDLPDLSLGAALVSVGDLDGDGVPELAVGAPGKVSSSTQTTGEVRLVSGADEAVLGVAFGDLGGTRFGAALAAHPDLSGDGVPDLVVGAPAADRVVALDGAALAAGVPTEVWASVGEAESRFGHALLVVPDRDDDGVPDVAVGAPLAGGATPGFGSGRVDVLSGSDGQLLASVSAPARDGDLDAFGWSLAELDADTWIVGAPAQDGLEPRSGAVHLVTAADLEVDQTFPGTTEDGELGFAVARGPRVEGRSTFLVGAPASQSTAGLPGTVLWLDAIEGTRLGDWSGCCGGGRFGWTLEPTLPRAVAVGEPGTGPGPDLPGSVHLVDLFTGMRGTLTGTQPAGEFGAAVEWIAPSRALSSASLAVGAPSYDDTLGGDQGAVEVFGVSAP